MGAAIVREGGARRRVDKGASYFLPSFALFEPETALKIKFINEF